MPGVFWTHNDSGDKPRLFAFSEQGKSIGQVIVRGAKAIDWEDMASGTLDGVPWLWVGDTGDNSAQRREVTVYGFPEPNPTEHREVHVAKRWQIVFPAGPRDCEALAFDARERRLLLFDKTLLPTSRAWGVSIDARTDKVIATDLGGVNVPLITAADCCEKSGELLIGTYLDAFKFTRRQDPTGHFEPLDVTLRRKPVVVPLPRRKQGEAICYSIEGDRIAITSEGRPAGFWAFANEVAPTQVPARDSAAGSSNK
jgi:hypothetical protein